MKSCRPIASAPRTRFEQRGRQTIHEDLKGRAWTVKYVDLALFDGKKTARCLSSKPTAREPLETARRQTESYALRARALVFVVTDSRTLKVWQYRRTGRSELVLTCEVSTLPRIACS
jgi:hypothetical protein